MNAQIADLLKEVGIPVDPNDFHDCYKTLIPRGKVPGHYTCTVCLQPVSTRVDEWVCCGEVVTYEAHGFKTCWHCARQKYCPPFVWYTEEFECDQQKPYDRPNSGVQWTKIRRYSKQLQFRTLLNQYMANVRLTAALPWVEAFRKEVNVTDRMAYVRGREFLRKRKLHKHYGHLFKVIYDSGGYPPNLSSYQLQQFRVEVKAIEDFFYQHYRGKAGRTSMYSVPMLMTAILRQLGHVPYYHMYELKDKQLRDQVERFYEHYRQHVVNNRHHNVSLLLFSSSSPQAETDPNQMGTHGTS